MTFDIGTVLNEAAERLATSAGAILVGGLALFGIVRAAAAQDVVRGVFERLLEIFADPEFRAELGPEELQALEDAERAIEAALAELPLALGLSPGVAALVWLLAFVLGLVVVTIALEAFGHERDTLDGSKPDGMGWKVLNLLLGLIAFGILFVIGLVLFVVPGLVIAVLLLFFPAAVVLDGESFVGAFGSSVDVVRENVLGTIGLVLVSVGVSIAISIVSTIFGAPLPAGAAAIVGELLSALGLAFTLALIARAYVRATAEASPTDEWTGHEEGVSSDDSI